MHSPTPFPLWESGAPGALGSAEPDIPALTRFDPPSGRSNGASMLVLPGGGYARLADHEGSGYARWFARLGVTVFVLKYRLGGAGYRHPAMLQDAARALRVVRRLARDEGRDPGRVGVIGSSAGGHLASTLLVHHDAGSSSAADPVERESSRPDLGLLCYPVISLVDFVHQGTVANLLGAEPPTDLLRHLSSNLHVTTRTPPCFVWHTADDAVVPVEHSLLFAFALRRAGVPFDLHIYESGVHGLGLPENNPAAPAWDLACERWLKGHGFL